MAHRYQSSTIHGTNPQNLIEKIVRNRIFRSIYWKEKCFGLNAESLADRAMDLREIGGTFGGTKNPSDFLCLLLAMLQMQPDIDIVLEFIKNEDYRYVRILGAFYLRMVGLAPDIYGHLEPLLSDFRALRKRTDIGFEKVYVDQVIDDLLHKEFYCDISFPFLLKRHILEEAGSLNPRVSLLEEEFTLLEASKQALDLSQPVGLSIISTTESDRHHRSRSRSRSPERHLSHSSRRSRRSSSRSRRHTSPHRSKRRDRRSSRSIDRTISTGSIDRLPPTSTSKKVSSKLLGMFKKAPPGVDLQRESRESGSAKSESLGETNPSAQEINEHRKKLGLAPLK